MKVPTGIPGLDGLMEGGFDEGSVNLLSGKTGTCKSIFASQFIYCGATKHGDNGLYITTGENIGNIRKQASKFGWDFEGMEKKKKVKMEPEKAPRVRRGAKRIIEEKIEIEESEQEAFAAVKAREKEAEEKRVEAKPKEKKEEFKPYVSEEPLFGVFAEKLKSALDKKKKEKKKK